MLHSLFTSYLNSDLIKCAFTCEFPRVCTGQFSRHSRCVSGCFYHDVSKKFFHNISSNVKSRKQNSCCSHQFHYVSVGILRLHSYQSHIYFYQIDNQRINPALSIQLFRSASIHSDYGGYIRQSHSDWIHSWIINGILGPM